MTKRCNKCGETKPVSDFYRQPGRPNSYRSRCKVCVLEENRQNALKRTDTTHRRKLRIKKAYKLSYKDYLDMLLECGNKCEICGVSGTHEKPLSVDHCHETGTVRGILCSNCNSGLGFFRDDKSLVAKAQSYLERDIDMRRKSLV